MPWVSRVRLRAGDTLKKGHKKQALLRACLFPLRCFLSYLIGVNIQTLDTFEGLRSVP